MNNEQSRGRHADIILEALATYDEWNLDDDYDAFRILSQIMRRMRERLDMAAIPKGHHLTNQGK